jgi:hypothetical protein
MISRILRRLSLIELYLGDMVGNTGLVIRNIVSMRRGQVPSCIMKLCSHCSSSRISIMALMVGPGRSLGFNSPSLESRLYPNVRKLPLPLSPFGDKGCWYHTWEHHMILPKPKCALITWLAQDSLQCRRRAPQCVVFNKHEPTAAAERPDTRIARCRLQTIPFWDRISS